MKQKVNIAGVGFDGIRYQEVLTAVESFVKQGGAGHMIVTPNPEMLVEAQSHPDFMNTLNASTLSVPDGIGILWAAYYLSLPEKRFFFSRCFQLFFSLLKVFIRHPAIYKQLPERVTGSDLLFRIVESSQAYGARIYLLGAAPGVAGVAVDRLLQKYPQAIFAGHFAGTPAASHEDELCEMINKSQADILFVSYGAPAQEEWIHRNLAKLDTVKVAIGVGGAIDFAADRVKRAPLAFQKLGLEWFYRLLQEPRRIRRIWRATVGFVRLIWKRKYL